LVIQLFDIRAYLQDRTVMFATEGKNVSPGWIGIQCVFCDDRENHLGINLTSNAVSCWRCGKKSIIKLIRALENDCFYSEALAIMEKYEDPSRLLLIATDEVETPRIAKVDIPKNFEKLSWNKYPNMIKVFLESRGFNVESFLRERISYYSGFTGDFKFRLILPVMYRNQLVSYVGRDVTGKSSIKYRNLEEEKSVIPIKNTLYGFDDVPPGGNVVVVEGPLDQIRLGAGSVATFGTQWTMKQVSLLRGLNPNKLFILFDSEDVARDSAKKLSDQIWFCDSEVIELDGKKDPGELTIEEGKELMESLR